MKRTSKKRLASDVLSPGQLCTAPQIHPELADYLSYCLVKVAVRLRTAFDKTLEPFGLIAPQSGMLRLLEVEGSLTQIEIGNYMNIDKATMVRLLDNLEELKMVRRVASKEDRRAKHIELTPAGRRTLEKVRTLREDVEADIFKDLTKAERASAHSLMKRVLLGKT